MVITSVIDTEYYHDIFRHRVLLNAHYWQSYLHEQTRKVEALDNERDRIIKAIWFALDLDEAWPSARDLIEAFSSYMERRGYWDIWHQILKRAINVAKNVGDISGVTNISALFARLLFQQSHFQEAVVHYRQTVRMARQIGDQFNEARAYTNLGYYYIDHGHLYRAEVLCCHALKLFEQLDSNHGRAHTENHLGILYTRQHRWAHARQHLERAGDLWRIMGDEHGLMRVLINLGGLHIKMEQPNEALGYLEKALDQAKLTGDEITIGRIYVNMGHTHIIGADLAKAEAHTRRAETIFRQYSNAAELARVWGNLGVIYSRQGKWDEAISNLENSLAMWRNLKNNIDEINTLMDMIEYELAKGNRQQARVRIKEVDQLIRSNQDNVQYRHLQSRLDKLRHGLTEL